MMVEERSESKDGSFLRFIIVSTITVVGIALCVLSPWIFYIGMINLGLRGAPLNYIAFATFWSIFIVILILAVAIDRVKKKTE